MKELSQKEKYLLNINRIHMIGIGGSGMCPLAEILYKKGYQISGSDNNESDPLKRVRTFAKVSLGHKKENVDSAQLVVYPVECMIMLLECVELMAKQLLPVF